ncbi:unnamed protein product [Mesocestoides corti]|uniref:BHLH domain-containing protein n=1 Tax=Mesocestoides corti TaxID=53468 RepID=A0A0R3UIK6_MESCO|nr:unnamed protein product [Mesocestoides corti]
MSHKVDLVDRRRAFPEYSEDSGLKHRRGVGSDVSGKSGQVENEKRVRREIANCNERRRMQSINAGFDNLRVLLPPAQDGEKLSKATILQQTAKFINTLLMKVSALEHEVAVYRRTSGLPAPTVLADITEEVATGFVRKRRSEDRGKPFEPLKMPKPGPDTDAALLDLDDGNTSGRSSECYDGNFGFSPSSNARLPSASPAESTANTAARLEHLVMAIEQIEGAPANTPPQLMEKQAPVNEPLTYVPQEPTIYYKFPDSVPELRPFTYGINSTDPGVTKQNMNSFTEEFVLNSTPPALQPTLVPVCEDKNAKEITVDDYHPVAKLLNRPIPHKYLHRPQVVVNNSH